MCCLKTGYVCSKCGMTRQGHGMRPTLTMGWKARSGQRGRGELCPGCYDEISRRQSGVARSIDRVFALVSGQKRGGEEDE